jgi:hypothetical protein
MLDKIKPELIMSSQKLSVAEIASQFRGVAAIWVPNLKTIWIAAYAGMTISTN